MYKPSSAGGSRVGGARRRRAARRCGRCACRSSSARRPCPPGTPANAAAGPACGRNGREQRVARPGSRCRRAATASSTGIDATRAWRHLARARRPGSRRAAGGRCSSSRRRARDRPRRAPRRRAGAAGARRTRRTRRGRGDARRHWRCAAGGRAPGGHQVQVAPVDEVAARATAEAAQPQPSREAGPANVDRDGSEAEVGACEIDVGDAADPAAGDVDDLRIEDVARQGSSRLATAAGSAVVRAQHEPVGSNVRPAPTARPCRVPAARGPPATGPGMLVRKVDPEILEASGAHALLVGHLGAEAVAEPEQSGALGGGAQRRWRVQSEMTSRSATTPWGVSPGARATNRCETPGPKAPGSRRARSRPARVGRGLGDARLAGTRPRSWSIHPSMPRA